MDEIFGDEKTAQIQLPQGQGSILLVDGDPQVRRPLAKVLEMEGYRVFVAASGTEALDRLPGIPRPCVVLVDLRRPALTGSEFYGLLGQDVAVVGLPSPPEGASPWSDGGHRTGRVEHIDALLKTVERYCR